MPKLIDADIRFQAKWRLDETTGCHVWTATTVGGAYGLFYVNERKRQILAHRFAYERSKGPIPVGLHIDHLCRNKSCVNPEHLEAVTHQENHRRVVWKVKTHCKRGHALTGDNVYVRPKDKGRRCKACDRLSSKAWQAARYVSRKPFDPDSLPPTAGLLSLAFM